MAKRYFALLAIALAVIATVGATAARLHAQQDGTRFRISVDLVQLNVAVTDNKGNYVTGLKPTDFVITEDGIRQRIATFAEGNQAPRAIVDFAQGDSNPQSVEPNPNLTEAAPATPSDPLVGANVFVLFDTSNYMYRGFAFAQDAIADFVRSLDGPDRIAL
jgi:VWFA-related protein